MPPRPPHHLHGPTGWEPRLHTPIALARNPRGILTALLHTQIHAISKSCWLYFQNVSRIRSLPHAQVGDLSLQRMSPTSWPQPLSISSAGQVWESQHAWTRCDLAVPPAVPKPFPPPSLTSSCTGPAPSPQASA